MRTTVTDSFAFVYTDKPLSYNADTKKKVVYKRKLSSVYSRFYNGMIVNDDLFAIIYYFFKENTNLDADNISKPAWDALTGLAYTDDKQIKIRTAVSIDLRNHDFLQLNTEDLPPQIMYDLTESIYENDHTVLVVVGRIHNYDNVLSIHSLWK